jgi:outer membrane protein
MLSSGFRPVVMRLVVDSAVALAFALCASRGVAQTAPVSADRPWHGPGEKTIGTDAKKMGESTFSIDPAKIYTLAELIDLAESHNPETRLAWERARSQAAALGIARSELYPTLAAAALAGVTRSEIYLATRFYRQTAGDFQVALNLNYTVFDFGARAGRIAAARAEALAANFSFNDSHRQVIFEVQQAYYQLLNASGQEDAARANLANAQAVQQAAEDRLNNGLATLPDVLEARAATAQAQYELQSVLGTEQIAAGNLATALGTSASASIHAQPLKELSIPESVDESVDTAIDRALVQRPDLLQQVAEVRAANARVKEARAAYYPSLNFTASPTPQALYGQQQQLAWGQTADLVGGLAFNLNWTVFDGGARKNKLAQAQANVRAEEAQVKLSRDEIANQVWAAYSNFNTALRQRQAATALLEAASQSYDAALESYNYGLRNFLDVTAAQRTLAQARSTDVFARTQVLTFLADLAFRAADSIQPSPTKTAP